MAEGWDDKLGPVRDDGPGHTGVLVDDDCETSVFETRNRASQSPVGVRRGEHLSPELELDNSEITFRPYATSGRATGLTVSPVRPVMAAESGDEGGSLVGLASGVMGDPGTRSPKAVAVTRTATFHIQ